MALRDRHSILILHVLFWEEIIVDVLLVRIDFLEYISSLDDRLHGSQDLLEMLMSVGQLFSFEFEFLVWDRLC